MWLDEAYEEARSSTSPGLPIEGRIVGAMSGISPRFKGRTVSPLTMPTIQIQPPDSRGFELVMYMNKQRYTLRVPFELLSTAWVDENLLHMLFRVPVVFDTVERQFRFEPFWYPNTGAS